MDLINDGILWKFILEKLASSDRLSAAEIHTDGNRIIVKPVLYAYIIADFLDQVGYAAHVGCDAGYYYIDVE